jgi:hypothetical protein
VESQPHHARNECNHLNEEPAGYSGEVTLAGPIQRTLQDGHRRPVQLHLLQTAERVMFRRHVSTHKRTAWIEGRWLPGQSEGIHPTVGGDGVL